MHKNINLDSAKIVTLVALAEGIKQVRPMTGPADLNDLASRLKDLAKACNPDSTDTISASVNGCWFTYPNTNALVTKAGLKAEAEAQRLTSATLHLVEDLFTGHAIGQGFIGGVPEEEPCEVCEICAFNGQTNCGKHRVTSANDSDGDTNEGSDQEVFDDQYGRMPKYMGSIDIGHKNVQDPVFIPMGVNLNGQQWGAFTNESPKPRWHTKVVRVIK